MPRPMRNMAAAIAAVLILLPALAAAQGDGPASVVTDTVAREEVSETVDVFGEVVPTRESEVAVRIAGAVTDVRVESGTQVAAGDVLAVIDRELLRLELRSAEAALAEAEAGVKVAEADLQQARQAFARVEGLRGTNAFSQGAFEDLRDGMRTPADQVARSSE